ncbi:MAG: imidazole glycerol phosphate synthase subunit HisH [Phycisphaerales bacterium JB037]
MPASVLVIPTGSANIASMLAGLARIGAAPELSSDPDRIADAPAVVLPGVGTLASAMTTIRAHALEHALRARIERDLPTLCVCVGLQALLEGSEESPGVAGLGIVPGIAERFTGVRSPQMGWNRVVSPPAARILATGDAYFANSFRLVRPPEGFLCATADHAGPFVAAFERGNLVACQFHPELSGRYGLGVMSRWLAHSRETTRCS